MVEVAQPLDKQPMDKVDELQDSTTPQETTAQATAAHNGMTQATEGAEVSQQAAGAPAQVLRGQSFAAYVEAQDRFPQLRVEYIHGEIVMTPAPTPRHQLASANLMFALQAYVRENDVREDDVREEARGMVLAAPLDVILEPEAAVVQPDVIFIRQARVAELVQPQNVQGAPDLIVEILSPSTARVDRAMKLQLYARHGVPEYWIVNPIDGTIEVYTRQEEGYLVAGVYVAGETIAAGQFAQANLQVNAVFGEESTGAEGATGETAAGETVTEEDTPQEAAAEEVTGEEVTGEEN